MSGERWPWLVLAAVLAGAIGIGEAVAVASLPRGTAWRLWLRRLPLRWAALSLLLLGQERLAQAAAAAVWQDLDAFLLRSGPVNSVAMEAAWPAVGMSCLGLLLARLSFTPSVSVALATFVAFAEVSSWLAIWRTFPLVIGRAGWLCGLAAPVVTIACGVGLTGVRAAWRQADLRGLQRLGGRMLAIGLLAGWWVFGDKVLGPWPSIGVGVLFGLAGLSAVWWPERDERRPGGRWRGVVEGLARQQPGPWLRLAFTGCLIHWLVLTVNLPWVAADGRRLLHRLAEHPQLMTLRADPTAAEWAATNLRLRQIVKDYRPHPWCGQWQLLIGWIESSRLHHFHTATIVLKQAAETHPQAHAVAPPGWAEGHSVKSIAEQMLAEWGRVLNPGRLPA